MSRAWISTLDDGRTNYRFHQSFIGETDTCLERTRLGIRGELPEDDTDATATGTAVHAGAEITLNTILEYGEPIDLGGAQAVAQETFDGLIAAPHFRWVQRQERWCRGYIDRAVAQWYEEVMPDLDPVAVEPYVGPFVAYEDDTKIIEFAGSIDYVDARLGLVDWKTAGRAYEPWEKRRWNVQATIYTWLWAQHCAEMGWQVPPTPHPFTFVVMLKTGGLQRLSVDRTEKDWAWMVRKAQGIVAQIERGTEGLWPMNDQSALCSPKFCPAWSGCKGLHLGPEPW